MVCVCVCVILDALNICRLKYWVRNAGAAEKERDEEEKKDGGSSLNTACGLWTAINCSVRNWVLNLLLHICFYSIVVFSGVKTPMPTSAAEAMGSCHALTPINSKTHIFYYTKSFVTKEMKNHSWHWAQALSLQHHWVGKSSSSGRQQAWLLMTFGCSGLQRTSNLSIPGFLWPSPPNTFFSSPESLSNNYCFSG